MEIKEPGPSSSNGVKKVSFEDKGKGKLVSVLGLEESDFDVLPLGKRDRVEEGEPSAKKSKQTEDVVTY